MAKISCVAKYFLPTNALIVTLQNEPSGEVVWFAGIAIECILWVFSNTRLMGQKTLPNRRQSYILGSLAYCNGTVFGPWTCCR